MVMGLPLDRGKLPRRPFFEYPPGSASALLDGTLRYCAARFASKVPTWRLPPGGGADLVTEGRGGGW